MLQNYKQRVIFIYKDGQRELNLSAEQKARSMDIEELIVQLLSANQRDFITSSKN